VAACCLRVRDTVVLIFCCIGEVCKVSVASEVYRYKSRFRLMVSKCCAEE